MLCCWSIEISYVMLYAKNILKSVLHDDSLIGNSASLLQSFLGLEFCLFYPWVLASLVSILSHKLQGLSSCLNLTVRPPLWRPRSGLAKSGQSQIGILLPYCHSWWVVGGADQDSSAKDIFHRRTLLTPFMSGSFSKPPGKSWLINLPHSIRGHWMSVADYHAHYIYWLSLHRSLRCQMRLSGLESFKGAWRPSTNHLWLATSGSQ